jgi:hypothetical protein
VQQLQQPIRFLNNPFHSNRLSDHRNGANQWRYGALERLVSTFSGFLNRSVSQPRSAYSCDETNGFVLIAETPEAQPVEQPTNGEQVEGQQEEESSGGMSYPRYPG